MTEPFERYGRTIRVDGGIRAQSTRGAIGESWWSKRFLAVLESFALGSRLTRGRNYARQGQVLSLDIQPSTVTASVQGSHRTPYEVHIALSPVDDDTWEVVETVLAEQALFSARLLSGDMPQQIEGVFTAAGSPLFPTSVGQLTMRCSCPDFQVPCKHLAATFYLLAEAFDADPFQILHWRGRDRQTLLDHLRAHRSRALTTPDQPDDEDNPSYSDTAADAHGASGDRASGDRDSGEGPLSTNVPAEGRTRNGGRGQRTAKTTVAPRVGASAALSDLDSPPLSDTVDRFWVAPVPLSARPPTLDTEVDLLLRQLAAPDSTLGGAELLARLRTLYTSLPAA